MSVHRVIFVVVLMVMAFPVALADEHPWAVHAVADLEPSQAKGLEELYAPVSLSTMPETNDDRVRWAWWSWSEETGSSWPDDDALYRASSRNLTVQLAQETPTVETHDLPSEALISVAGEVKVVSAEDRARMIAFDLEVTPLENLSNHTILYVVLTEDRAVDQHQRKVNHLVRELRPEVGFSVKANNTTSFVSMLPADHLAAAGVNLKEETTGWSYTVAVFGTGAEEENESRLLWMAHGSLPAPQQNVTATQAWMPLLLTAIALVIAASIIGALRQREKAIPNLQAAWSADDEHQAIVRIKAGTHPFRITAWTVDEPWHFKGRPPRLELKAGEQRETAVVFRETLDGDLHLDVAIDIDEFGAWKQHLWLQPRPDVQPKNPQ